MLKVFDKRDGLRVLIPRYRRCDEDSDPAYPQRLSLARKLFIEWTGVTNPELQAVLWGNLNNEDRNHWLAAADRRLKEGE